MFSSKLRQKQASVCAQKLCKILSEYPEKNQQLKNHGPQIKPPKHGKNATDVNGWTGPLHPGTTPQQFQTTFGKHQKLNALAIGSCPLDSPTPPPTHPYPPTWLIPGSKCTRFLCKHSTSPSFHIENRNLRSFWEIWEIEKKSSMMFDRLSRVSGAPGVLLQSHINRCYDHMNCQRLEHQYFNMFWITESIHIQTRGIRNGWGG